MKSGYVVRYICPCCGYPTNSVPPAGFETCLLCGWTDDGQNDSNADKVLGGPNQNYSLTEARENFKLYLKKFRPSDKNPMNIEIQGEREIREQLMDSFKTNSINHNSTEIFVLDDAVSYYENELHINIFEKMKIWNSLATSQRNPE